MNHRLVGLLIVWLTLIGGNYFAYMVILPVRIAHHSLITALLVYWLVKRGLPHTPFLIPLAGMIVAAVVSAALSNDPRMAMENVWFWLNHALLLLLFIDLTRQGYSEVLIRSHFWVVGVVSVIGIAQLVLGASTRPTSLFQIINLAGAYCAPLVVVGAAWWYSKRDHLYLVPTLLALLFVLVNQSRGGLLALTVGLLAFAFLQSILPKRVLLIGLPVAVLGILLLLFRVGSDSHRFDVWRTAIVMIGQHPIIGVGPGLFGIEHRDLAILLWDYVGGAHNLVLNTWAEVGWVGFSYGAALFVVFAANIPRQRTAKQNGVFAALIAIGAHEMFDHQIATTYAALVMVLIAYLVPTGQQTFSSIMNDFADRHRMKLRLTLFEPSFGYTARMLRPVAICALLVFGAWFVCLDVAQSYYEHSLVTGDIAAAQTAYNMDALDLYRLQLQKLMIVRAFGQDVTFARDIVNRDQFAMTNFARYWR